MRVEEADEDLALAKVLEVLNRLTQNPEEYREIEQDEMGEKIIMCALFYIAFYQMYKERNDDKEKIA